MISGTAKGFFIWKALFGTIIIVVIAVVGFFKLLNIAPNTEEVNLFPFLDYSHYLG